MTRPGGDNAQRRLEEALAGVCDPEIPALTIAEIGILRGCEIDADGHAVVIISPTYSGCPAMETIRADIGAAVHAAGLPGVRIRTVLAPAWSSRRLSEAGRAKLRACGIAPPADEAAQRPDGRAAPLLEIPRVPPRCPRCPVCGNAATGQLSPFGPSPCIDLWRCEACGEPFEHFKEH